MRLLIKICKGIGITFILFTIICIIGISCDSDTNEESKVSYDVESSITDEGKEIIKNFKEHNEYKEVEINHMEAWNKECVKFNCVIDNIDADEGDKFEHKYYKLTAWSANNPYPLKIYAYKDCVDINFNEGDEITVYGRYNGVRSKSFRNKRYEYHHVTAHYLEK